MAMSRVHFFYSFALSSCAFIFWLPCLEASPKGFRLVAGEAKPPVSSGSTVSIETGERAVIHWDDFSIGKGETTRFIMPGKGAAVLNRVMGGNASEILGTLKANGKVYLINPKGVLFGEGAVVDTASFFASTLDACDADFLKGGDLLFKGDSQASIINLGKISAWDGDLILIGYRLENRGSLEAKQGLVGLASGSECLIQQGDAERILIRASASSIKGDGGIENSGWITALKAELKADGNAYQYAIKDSGRIDALSTQERGGRIYLCAEEGVLSASGQYVAKNSEGIGGEIRFLAEKVTLESEAYVDVSGRTGGGRVLVGGDFQGNNPAIPNAKTVYVAPGAMLSADALDSGNGGRIALWADEWNGFFGSIFARGGASSGDGGFVEVSSHGFLAPNGLVHALAPHGTAGTLWLDPCAVTIQAGGTDPFNGCPTGTYTFVGGAVTIDSVALGTHLGTCSVVVDASASGSAPVGNITVNSPITWNAPTSLTLTATDVGSFIAINDLITSSFTTNAATTPVLLVASPEIRIGSTASTTNCGLKTLSGGIQISPGSGSLTLQGSNAATATASLTTQNGGNIAVTLSSFLNMTAGTSVGSSVSIGTSAGAGAIAISSGGNLTMQAGTGAGTGSFAEISTSNGNISLSATGQIALTGGNATGNYSRVDVGSSANTIGIGMGGLALTGGVASGTDAEIISLGGMLTIDGTATTSGVISLLGQTSSAQILTTTNAQTSATDVIRIGQTAGTLLPTGISMQGGTGAVNARAVILTDVGGNIVSAINGNYGITAGSSVGDARAGFYSGFTSGTGNITLDALTSGNTLTLLSGASTGSNGAQIATGTAGGTIQIDVNGAIQLTAGGSANQNTYIQTQSATPSSITILGQSLGISSSTTAASAVAGILTQAGDITIGTALNPFSGAINVTAGSLANTNAQILSSVSGNISIYCDDLTVQGSSATTGTNGSASIGTTSGSSSIGIHCSGTFTANGGNATNAFAEVLSPGTVDMSIGVGLDLNGTTTLAATNSYARISATEGVTINGPGSFLLTGGSATTSFAEIQSFSGPLVVGNLSPIGNLILNGGSVSGARLVTQMAANIATTITGNYQFTGGTSTGTTLTGIYASETSGVGTIAMTGGTMTNTAGGNTGTNNVTITTGPSGGSIDITLTGAMQLTGGATANQQALITTTGPASPITIATGPLGLGGSSSVGATNALAKIETVTGAITITATGDANLISGVATGANAQVDVTTSGAISFSCANLQISGSNTSVAPAFITTQAGDISVTCAGNCTLIGDAVIPSPVSIETFGSDLTLTAGGSVFLLAESTVAVPAVGNLLIIAGRDITVDNTANVTVNGTGSLTLVVDNDFPTAPGIGRGASC